MGENMISLKRKADFKEILSNLKEHKPWTEQEKEVPITQSAFFTQLVMLITSFSRTKNKNEFAFEVFGTMCGYISRNYSIEPAKDLLAALEQNSIRVGTPPDAGFLIDLMDNICRAGYQRCGTATLIPFVAWFHSCDISLQEIRETLILSYTLKEETKKIEPKTKKAKPLKKKALKRK